MRVTYVGHAGLLIEAGGVAILCDPWLSERGAFLSGWFQLPRNHHLKARLLGRKIDYLYVSHGHLDHFDADTLADLPKDITLIVAAFPSRPWREQVRALGFRRVRFLRSFETVDLADGVSASIVMEDSPYFADSALVVAERDGEALVNLNDCHISERQARDIAARYPRISAVFAQFSGANWFPFVYDFAEEVRVQAARNKVQNSFRRWKGYMDLLRPRWAVPFAGPPCMLDHQTRRYMDGPDSIFSSPLDLKRWLTEAGNGDLAGRTVLMLPGDALDLPGGDLREDAEMHASFSWERLREYVDAYAWEMEPAIAATVGEYPWPAEPLFPAFRAYWERLFEAGPRFAVQVGARVVFDITGEGGGRWLVDFPRLAVEDVSTDPRAYAEIADYAFRLESRYVVPILKERLGWSDVFLSFRFGAWRPDVAAYNEHLMTFLRFGKVDDIRAREGLLAKAQARYEQGTFRLETPDGVYEVQRFCPHTGERLGADCYDPARRAVVCPRHGWTFDIPGGECRNGRARLRVECVPEVNRGDGALGPARVRGARTRRPGVP